MKKRINLIVGLFVIIGLVAFIGLAFQVSGLTHLTKQSGYDVTAKFTNIGNLKVRAPVTIGGVRIGEVKNITLDPTSFYATVTLHLETQDKIPAQDTTARILTEGLLGSNYISIEPGFDDAGAYLKSGCQIQKTQPAMILENIIGQLLFSINK